jgi:hypothetical protein
MRTVFFAATSCLFVTLISSVSSAQQRNQPERQLLDSSGSLPPAYSQHSANAAFAALFEPVPITAIPASPGAAGCVAPAASPTVPPVPVASSATLPAAPEPALPNSDSAEASTAAPVEGTPAAAGGGGAPPATASFARVPIAPQPKPDSVQRFVFSNTAMYGATVFHAFGRAAEVDACKREVPVKNGVYTAGPYKGQAPATVSRFYAISLPIDAGVTLLSALARHKGWRAFEIAGPLSAASAHITAGAFKFSSGCY